MNTTIYLFGKFRHGITASVNDYTQSFFEQFISKANAPTQIIIHRDGDIMNYGYVRKISESNLFGVCAQINGQYLSTTKKLFEAFENIVASIAVRGDILSLNRKGDLEVVISNFLDKPEAVERAIESSLAEFARLSSSCRDLPDIDYSTADSDTNCFKESANSNAIIKSSLKNGYTFIYKEQDYDSVALSGYRSTLAALNRENDANKQKIKEQENQLKILERKKKQMGVVMLLLVAITIGSTIFFNTLEEKNQDIAVRDGTIRKQRETNNSLTAEIMDISREKYNLQGRNDTLTVQKDSLHNALVNRNAEFDALFHEYERLQRERDSQINQLGASLRKLTNDNSSLKRRLSRTTSDLNSKVENYNTLNERYEHLRGEYNTLRKKYSLTKEGKREYGDK